MNHNDMPTAARAVRETFLPFSPPLIDDADVAGVVETLRSDWLSTGPKTKRFEQEFAAHVGSPEALALNSCTAGLHVALAALGIGPGDEVITTTMTFAATANVVEHVGARPILVDVEPDTLCIDPAAIERAITPRTRAIIPVHYAGHAADMDPINALAKAGKMAVVEDAAHALGTEYRGTSIGAGGNPTAYSFYATKNLTTGEGGMLTGSPEFIARARVFSSHGMDRDAWKRFDRAGTWKYDVVVPGFKYNMMDIQASLGLTQLARFAEMQQRRYEIAALYNAAFGAMDALQIPAHRADVGHAWHLYVLRIRPDLLTIGRDQFIEELKQRNIGTSVHYRPVHEHPFYRDKYNLRPSDYPVAQDAYERMLSIPLNPRLTDSDVGDVIDAIAGVIADFRR